MGFTEPLVYFFDELFGADEDLRGQARKVAEAADDLNVDAGGLPPEAQAIVAGVRALRGELTRAAEDLRAAGTTLGQTGADAKRADQPGWLDYTKALLAIGSGEASMLLLRGQSRRVVANARANVRRNQKLLARLEANGGSRSELRNRKKALQHAQRTLDQAKRDVRTLREAGQLGGFSARTRRAIKAVAPLFGVKAAGDLLSAAEFGNEVRKARSVRDGAREHLANRREGSRVFTGRTDDVRGMDRASDTKRSAEAAKRLLDSPGTRQARRLIPIVNVGADGIDFGNRARKAWQKPNFGNLAATVAGGCYLGSNVPGVGLLGDGCGTGIDSVKSVTDTIDEPEDVGDFIMGMPRKVEGGVDAIKGVLGR